MEVRPRHRLLEKIDDLAAVAPQGESSPQELFKLEDVPQRVVWSAVQLLPDLFEAPEYGQEGLEPLVGLESLDFTRGQQVAPTDDLPLGWGELAAAQTIVLDVAGG